MAGRFVAPKFGDSPFTCPHCDTLAKQVSGQLGSFETSGARKRGHGLHVTSCEVCSEAVVWQQYLGHTDDQLRQRLANLARRGSDTPEIPKQTLYRMIWPVKSSAPDPNPDLPDEVEENYREAMAVLPHSPRAAAALLRLALQRLCVHFKQPGKDINKDIGSLVAAGTIRPMVQEAMDTIRISGNESVHPGELNLNDDQELARALFEFINLVADEAITQPAKVKAMYERMPEGKRNGVDSRDKKAESA